MLLQFAVENFRSFKTEEMLNMIPATSKIHKDHVLTDNNGKSVKVLPLAVLYGANASGKSNLIKALAFAQQLIIKGTKGEETIHDFSSFRLDSAYVSKPARFEFVIKHEKTLYTYGFVISANKVEEEWLFAVANKKEVRYFERITKGEKAEVEIDDNLEKNREEKQRLGFVAKGTRPNQLFLTEANDRNVEKLKPLMRWFTNSLQIISPSSKYLHLIFRVHKDSEFKQFLGKMLSLSDTGIDGIAAKSEKMDFKKIDPDMPEEIKKSIIDSLAKGDRSAFIDNGDKIFTLQSDGTNSEPLILDLKTQHKAKDGKIIEFDTEDESDGTRRMMHIAPAILDLSSAEKVYVIDEIDRSMHPLLCRFFIEAFLKSILKKPSKGQLIVTTHQTCLLDLELLRRDEIWFVEKDKEGCSHLTSLADYKTRNDLKIDKGYLQGRFGAIPFIGDVKKLLK